jgi:DNA invertase Pin-like site-specific DNA recombinase
MKPAVAYLRFSREDQGKGSTIQRQSENILAYCQQHGLDVVETLIDEGFSASKGEHISHPKAKFRAFLARVDRGEFRGHALIVEQLDRLSRLGIDASSEIIRRLLKGGVTPHITQEHRAITSLDDLTTVVMNAIQAFGAAEYSKKLSERISAAWTAKKAKARTTRKAITANVPYWLEAVKDGEIRALPDRVATVQKIFRLAESGYGVKRIANQLAADGDQPFTRAGQKKRGKAWTLVYIQSILANRAVLGEYTPSGCEPIYDHFPRIITQTQFDRVRAAVQSRDRVSAETRRYCGGKGDGSRNLFSRMVFDAETGRTMNFHDKGGEKMFLVSAYEAGKKAKRIRYELMERGVLEFLGDVDWRSVANDGDPKELEGLKLRLNEVATEIDRLNRVIARDTKLVDDPDTDYETAKFMQKGLAEKDARLGQLTEARDKITAELNAERAKIGVIQDPAELAKLIRNKRKAVDIRLRLHQELKRRISRIELNFRDKSFITEALDTLESKRGKLGEERDFIKKMREITCTIQFANGVERRLLFQTGFPGDVYRMLVVEPGKGYRATWLKPQRTSTKPKG